MENGQKLNILKILLSSILLIIINTVSKSFAIDIILYIVAYLLVAYDVIKYAIYGLTHKEPINECFLMTIATVGAAVLAIYEKSFEFNESVFVMLFYRVGEFFEEFAVEKSRKNISNLMDIRPDFAYIEIDGKIEKRNPSEVAIGSIITVMPGEKVPLDGDIIDGSTTLDLLSLTGESIPKSATIGDSILSGAINLSGMIKVKTTKVFSESTVSKILDLVENASEKKSKSENFISKFASVYTPVVIILALFIALIMPFVSNIIVKEGLHFGMWLYRALTFLVISCPCALVISIPLSFFAGIGGASRNGILIKGSNHLETLSKITSIVYDKTGTLTKGVFEVEAIHQNQIDENKLIELTAHAEAASTHPISLSIRREYGKQLDRDRIKQIEEISGYGVKALIDDMNILAGNEKLMNQNDISYTPCDCIGTKVHVAINGQYAGHIVINDVIKETSKEAVMGIKNLGINKQIMLTGDSEAVASKVASELSIDEYKSSLLPSDKVSEMEKLLENKKKNEYIAFVGDGINDAPVLIRSDIGIAMGAIGSDAAIEAADIVLMDDNPLKIKKAIKISRKCLGIVYQNIFFALGVKVICLLLASIGIANMGLAIFSDVGVMVIAVLNAIRALKA